MTSGRIDSIQNQTIGKEIELSYLGLASKRLKSVAADVMEVSKRFFRIFSNLFNARDLVKPGLTILTIMICFPDASLFSRTLASAATTLIWNPNNR